MKAMKRVRGWGLFASGALHLAALAWLALPSAQAPAGPTEPVAISTRILPMPTPRAQLAVARTRPQPPAMALPAQRLVPMPELVFEAPAAAAAQAAAAVAAAPAPASVAIAIATVATVATPSAPSPEPALQAARPPDRQCAEQGVARHYPRLLRERGIEGRVLLRVKVDETGRPAEIQVTGGGSGWRLLDEAAKVLTQACRFVPARRGEQPLASWVEYPVLFALQ